GPGRGRGARRLPAPPSGRPGGPGGTPRPLPAGATPPRGPGGRRPSGPAGGGSGPTWTPCCAGPARRRPRREWMRGQRGAGMADCPSVVELQALLADGLSAEQEQSILAHVEACPACQQTLESLTADAPPLPAAAAPREGTP